jgi:NAD-dependent dihydropyrimidine dehydrogenase PreA subunit
LQTRKIVQIDESLCNGCGSCIPKCAEGALKIVDGKATIVKDIYCDGLGACLGHCPQGAITIIEREAEQFDEEAARSHVKSEEKSGNIATVLQWPLKINLVPLKAPFYEEADLLITADCAPVALQDFKSSLLPGKRAIIGCPKFEDARAYAQKLGEILKQNNVSSITVAHMEVPCCSGLKWAVDKAVEASGKQIPIKRYEITIRGEMNER